MPRTGHLPSQHLVIKQGVSVNAAQVQRFLFLERTLASVCLHIEQIAASNPLVDISVPAELEEAREADIDVVQDGDAVSDARDLLRGEILESRWEEISEAVDPVALVDDDPRFDLRRQLRKLNLHPDEFAIGIVIIDRLDERGYFTEKLGDIARSTGASAAAVRAVLKRIQGLSPAGVATGGSRECLAAQLASRGYSASEVARFLDACALVGPHPSKIAQEGRLSPERVQAMLNERILLDPWPSPQPEFVGSIEPDFVAVLKPDGALRVELAREMPRITFNESDYAEWSRDGRRAGWKSEALRLISGVNDWTTMTQHVVQEVMNAQVEFLTKSDGKLVPLRQIDVARKLGVHNSLVSRVAKAKFVQTRRGTFPVAFFFTHKLPGTHGENAQSAHTVKSLIKQIIDREHRGEELSDPEIFDVLRSLGVNIERRTVAKYRRELGIASYKERKLTAALHQA